MQRFRSGLVFKALCLSHHSTLGLRVREKKKKKKKKKKKTVQGLANLSGVSIVVRVQGYLAHTKHPPPRTLHQGFTQGHMVVLTGGAVSYEQGTPVAVQEWLAPCVGI